MRDSSLRQDDCPDAAHFVAASVPKKYKVFTGDRYNLNIVGWRRRAATVDVFSDYICVYYLENNIWTQYTWPATTLPGRPWLLNPVNSCGTGIVVPGQYLRAYKLGEFKGYPALKQVKPLRVYRDNNRDSTIDINSVNIEEGLFGIHIHKAGIWSKLVGVSSAGCQVFQRAKDYEEFITLCKKASLVRGKFFTYTLLEF